MSILSRRSLVRFGGCALGAVVLSACAGAQDASGGDSTGSAAGDLTDAAAASGSAALDYMVLVNRTHKLPDGWEESLDLVEEKSLLYNDPVQVERRAYEAFQDLKDDLAAEDVHVELDSCYRSMAAQQEVVEDFTRKYGEEYVKLYVAVPGYSEHHTGLALDLFLVIDGQNVAANEEMVKHPDIWQKVHAKLAAHGFILRFLPQRMVFTGCSYEPWHIRYVGDPDVATQIMDAGLTFEEYLGEVDSFVAGCTVDYGTSSMYSEADIDAALKAVLEEFGTWTGCVMRHIAYAGDEASGTEEVAYVNSLREQGTDEFGQALVFVTDFHSPSAVEAQGTAWEPDTDYNDYTWHLGRTNADGAWQLMSWGYA